MKSRRKKQFIDSAVQGALARRIILHWLIFFVMVFFTLPLWHLMSSAEVFSPFSELMQESWAETAPVFVILLAMIPIFVWDTVTFSNRFTGPMYRLHSSIKSLAAAEEVQPIRLRKGDVWTNVAEDFNTMLERISREKNTDEPEDNLQAVPCGASAEESYLEE